MSIRVSALLLAVVASATLASASDVCSNYRTCYTCMQQFNCGWCPTSASCVSGSTSGPNVGSCNTNVWIPPNPGSPYTACSDTCGDNTTTNCQACVNYGSSCGWCADYGGACWTSYASEYSNCQNGYSGSIYQCNNPVFPYTPPSSSSGSGNTVTAIWVVIIVIAVVGSLAVYGWRYYQARRQVSQANERIAANVPQYVPPTDYSKPPPGSRGGNDAYGYQQMPVDNNTHNPGLAPMPQAFNPNAHLNPEPRSGQSQQAGVNPYATQPQNQQPPQNNQISDEAYRRALGLAAGAPHMPPPQPQQQQQQQYPYPQQQKQPQYGQPQQQQQPQYNQAQQQYAAPPQYGAYQQSAPQQQPQQQQQPLTAYQIAQMQLAAQSMPQASAPPGGNAPPPSVGNMYYAPPPLYATPGQQQRQF